MIVVELTTSFMHSVCQSCRLRLSTLVLQWIQLQREFCRQLEGNPNVFIFHPRCVSESSRLKNSLELPEKSDLPYPAPFGTVIVFGIQRGQIWILFGNSITIGKGVIRLSAIVFRTFFLSFGSEIKLKFAVGVKVVCLSFAFAYKARPLQFLHSVCLSANIIQMSSVWQSL